MRDVNGHLAEGHIAGAPQGVGLLAKVFQILDLFTAERPAWSQSELVKETGLARSTMSRLVRYLCDRGYLMYLERQARYGLGFAAVDLGRRAQAQFDLVALCAPLLEQLARQTGETVILTGYDEAAQRVVCLEQIPSTQDGLRVFESIGATFPLHAGASSKAVLACLPASQSERLLGQPLTPVNRTVPIDATALRRELARTRGRGYAISHEETYPGVAGVGVALLSPGGRPIGSIAIAGPVHRLHDGEIARFGTLLVAAARALDEGLGKAGPDGREPPATGKRGLTARRARAKGSEGHAG